MTEEIRTSGSERAPAVATPEWWDETRRELPMSREYLAFEIELAHVLAEKFGKSFKDEARWHTAFLASEIQRDLTIEGKSDEEILRALTERAVEGAEQLSREYHPIGTFQFGCFNFEYDRFENALHIHFHNRELDDTSPLADDKIDRRLEELRDMFTLAKRLYPHLAGVEGDSWLYNVPAYRRLFPASYLSNADALPASEVLESGHGIYGQFLNHDLTFRTEVAEKFLQDLRRLENPTLEEVVALFPRAHQSVRGPIKDFYEMYGIV